uniref:Uncharacterized protein n=1 Tax=Myoviridae sp. ctOAa14 TaxID=2826646 RepID=A0A8S5MRB4_9CAUD|nr:MAG TPA: hypothetical protein [Myoviridae sp. ctOAa14]
MRLGCELLMRDANGERHEVGVNGVNQACAKNFR